MKISINTESYNERRYGKPYIAVMDFSEDHQGKPLWGEWIGTAGYSGVLEVWAKVGDIVMQGQKDNRGRNGTPRYYQVLDDLSLKELGHNKADAYKAWQEWQDANPEPEATKPNTEGLHEKALAWKQEHGLVGGVVVFWQGQIQGWVNELRNPEAWVPGCIAMASDGTGYEAKSGNPYDGAKRWERIE